MKLSILAVIGALAILTSAVQPINLSAICKLEVDGVHGEVRDDISCSDCDDAYNVCAASMDPGPDTDYVCKFLTCRNGADVCFNCGYNNCK